MPVLLWLVLSFGLTALAPPPTAAALAPPTAALAVSREVGPTIPPGYTVRQAHDFGVACDGARDDTIALQNALNALNNRQALQLPAGTCLTSKQLRLSRKGNVAVVGAGKERTIVQATNPLHSSFIVANGLNVHLSGFQVYSPNTGGMKRTADAGSKGFFIKKSSGVVLDGVKVRQVLGAGILLENVRDSKILNSEVLKSLADAFHVTGGSQNVVVQGNLAVGAGDDAFASIGYGDEINRNIQFFDNEARDGRWGGGVAFEGTNGGKAYRNRIYRSGVAGLRVASQSNWKTGPSDNIDFQDNYLEGCVTRRGTDQGSVIIYSNFKNVGPTVTFLRTTIKNPATRLGVKAFGGPRVGATVTAKVDGSIMSGVTKDFNIGPNATILRAGNRVTGRSSL